MKLGLADGKIAGAAKVGPFLAKVGGQGVWCGLNNAIVFRERFEPNVERAMRTVPRERFVPPRERSRAHDDAPLPIGFGQTISQPSLVAHMTEQLSLAPGSRVLEVGTGSGYQTAILAEIAGEVFTIERLPELANAARLLLSELGYRNIRFKIGDGALGWPEEAPFDALIVTAAARTLPPALVSQLKPGGKMVVPLGSVERDNQMLVLLEKAADGTVRRQDLYAVRFVPLVTEAHGTLSDSPSCRDQRP